MGKASIAAANATKAALMGEGDQVLAQQAGAKSVAQVMGFPLRPVAIPTGAAYGDQPSPGPPYPLNSQQDPINLQSMSASCIGGAFAAPAFRQHPARSRKPRCRITEFLML